MSLSDLPVDVVQEILSYSDSIKLRNGKYMGQILKNDARYEMIKTRKRSIDFLFPEHPECFFSYIPFTNGATMQIRYSTIQNSILYTYTVPKYSFGRANRYDLA
jgi:hypothetical protein